MQISILARYALSCVAVATLASCGGSQPLVATGAPRPVFGIPARNSASSGIYASEYHNSGSIVYGYRKNNRRNDPPICSESVTYPRGDIAVDGKGNLIVPESFGEFSVFKGPGMCGPELGSIYPCCGGGVVDAASADAANGTITIAAFQDGSSAGSIELCTLKHGCTTNLRNPDMNFVYSVAVARNGDCWASSEQAESMGSGGAVLTYFKDCSGSGQTATGYQNAYAGGLDIDVNGNLVSISATTPAVYVYSACNPACKTVGGPFSLHGGAIYGHLDKDSTYFATADSQYGQVDVYRYSPKAVTYMYSFNNGLSSSTAVAYNPRSKL